MRVSDTVDSESSGLFVLDDDSLASMADSLRSQWQELCRRQAAFSQSLRKFDLAQGFAVDGSLSTQSWLRHKCRMTASQAAQQVMVCRKLDSLPETADAFASGDISYAHVAVVASCARKLGTAVVVENEAALVDSARRLDPFLLSRVTGHLEHMVDPDGSLGFWDRNHGHRYLEMTRHFDGTYNFRGVFDAEGGAVVATAIESVLKAPNGYEERSAGQRRADAFVEIMNKHLSSSSRPIRGKERPVVTVVTELSTLRKQPGAPAAELNGALIPGETARRIACDAIFQYARVAPDGINVEMTPQTRVIPLSMWRKLVVRDETCRFPGCDRPHWWCDGHHLIPVEEGGPTELWNLILCCRRHHVMLQEGGWRAEFLPDGELVVRPPNRN